MTESQTALPNDGGSCEAMVKVDHVSMAFNMASQQLNNLKEYAIALARRELLFKEFRALDDISIEVKSGDVFGILGSNGSGKSTLLKIIAGVLEPTEGAVEVNGNIAPLIELGAGFDHELTARENIFLNGALLGYSKKFIEQHFDEIVDFAEIGPFLDMPLKNYSSGMIARIAFAISTVIVPDILIVDEVLSVGDFMFQQKCERRIQALIKDHGTTVLIVSHSNDQIERLCNKAAWIEKGHLRMVGDAQSVCNAYRLLGGYGGNPEVEQRILELQERKATAPAGSISTISGDDRYGSAARLAQATHRDKAKEVVIACGEDAAEALVASSLAAALGAPLLLARSDRLPDATSHALGTFSPAHAYVLGTTGRMEASVVASLAERIPGIAVTSIEGADLTEVAENAYRHAAPWGPDAILAWDGALGDILSLSPRTHRTIAPLFYASKDGGISDATRAALSSGAFERILLLGGEEVFSAELASELADSALEVVRFCGKDAYDASRIINEWLDGERREEGKEQVAKLVVGSIWYPQDLLNVGAYAAAEDAEVLLVDPEFVPSMAAAIDFLEARKGSIRHLTFVGDEAIFSPLDKELLGKALAADAEQRSSKMQGEA